MSDPVCSVVWWLLQTGADVPATDDWLSDRERAQASELAVDKRRREWLLGRWTAKRALCEHYERHSDAAATFELVPEPDGAPCAHESGHPLPLVVSITHREDVAACVIAEAGTVLGCDLERVEPRTDRFVGDFFTGREAAQARALEGHARDLRVALTWSAKESVLKALRVGLRRDTRSVEVLTLGEESTEGWSDLEATDTLDDGKAFHGFWRREGSLILTMVASPPCAAPRRIGASGAAP